MQQVLEDTKLIESIINGDRESFDVFYKKEYKKLTNGTPIMVMIWHKS